MPNTHWILEIKTISSRRIINKNVFNYRWPRCSPSEIAVFICASHVWNALRKLNHKVQTFSAIKDTNVPQIKDTNVTKPSSVFLGLNTIVT